MESGEYVGFGVLVFLSLGKFRMGGEGFVWMKLYGIWI